jgi:hypothetical protein
MSCVQTRIFPLGNAALKQPRFLNDSCRISYFRPALWLGPRQARTKTKCHSQVAQKGENTMPQHASQDDLMKSLLGKLYTVLTGGDKDAPPAKDRFIAWCAPGIPISEEDLTFLSKGLVSDDPDRSKAALETKRLLAQASDFAKLVNIAPDPSGIYASGQQQATYEQKGHTLWEAYSNALKFSEVAKGELTPDEQAKIEKFRKLFTVTKKVKDLITDEEREEVADGPMIVAYKTKQADADGAILEYNNKRLNAMNASDPQIVQDWSLNADTYRRRLKTALDAWVSQGYKNDVDKMNAYINHVTQRDLTLWKKGIQEQLEAAKLTDLNNNQFYYTTVVPSNFYKSDKGWTKFSFSEAETSTYERSETNAWSAEGGAGWGPFKARFSNSGSISSNQASVDTSNFVMKFSIAQVPLSRPWFSPEFFMNKAWRFKDGLGMSPLSDGNTPPAGQLVAYPTAIVFARDILIDFAELHNSNSSYSQSIKAGASASYGLFSVSGNYSRDVGEKKTKSSVSEQGLKVEGMQIIGFKCAIVPKAPDLSPEIKGFE